MQTLDSLARCPIVANSIGFWPSFRKISTRLSQSTWSFYSPLCYECASFRLHWLVLRSSLHTRQVFPSISQFHLWRELLCHALSCISGADPWLLWSLSGRSNDLSCLQILRQLSLIQFWPNEARFCGLSWACLMLFWRTSGLTLVNSCKVTIVSYLPPSHHTRSAMDLYQLSHQRWGIHQWVHSDSSD